MIPLFPKQKAHWFASYAWFTPMRLAVGFGQPIALLVTKIHPKKNGSPTTSVFGEFEGYFTPQKQNCQSENKGFILKRFHRESLHEEEAYFLENGLNFQ